MLALTVHEHAVISGEHCMDYWIAMSRGKCLNMLKLGERAGLDLGKRAMFMVPFLFPIPSSAFVHLENFT